MASGHKQQALDWSSEQDEMLIDFVRTHECLYNFRCNDYRSVRLKQSLWNEIGRILKKKDVECSRRWAYVRDYYIRRRGKPGASSSGEATKKRSVQLSFLDSIPSVKRSTSKNIKKSKAEDLGNVISEVSKGDDSIKQEPEVQEDTWFSEEYELFKEEESSENFSQAETESDDFDKPLVQQKYEQSESAYADVSLDVLKQIADFQQRSTVVQKEEDENDLFFASMAKIVKRLPRSHQAKLRMQIGNLVGNAEIEYLSAIDAE